MCEPQHLTTLWASTAVTGIPLLYFYLLYVRHQIMRMVIMKLTISGMWRRVVWYPFKNVLKEPATLQIEAPYPWDLSAAFYLVWRRHISLYKFSSCHTENGHAVAWMVGALCYKPEGSIPVEVIATFQLTYSIQLHNDPGVGSASKRNE
jgi:hypothetical protein